VFLIDGIDVIVHLLLDFCLFFPVFLAQLLGTVEGLSGLQEGGLEPCQARINEGVELLGRVRCVP
jgi:hypothetical protein